ncbi:MAG: polyprenyl synthetase family protein [bacterium]
MSHLVGSEQFKNVLRELQDLINARLHKVLESTHPPILYEPIQYVLESNGKRIRPILLLLSCKASGGDVDRCWNAAVAVELLHNFTLVHDDIMDRDDTRRGQPTVHKKWDTDIALLAGDGLLALAYQALLRTQSERIQEIVKIFTDGIVELCEGQALDREFETRKDVQLKDYLLMIGKKTARLLNVSARIGALIGAGDKRAAQALGEFGYNLGCAFQIQDDLLDITSNEEIIGKTCGSDVRRKKQTYLLVHALNHADSETKNTLIDILYNSTIHKSQISEIKRIFDKIGSIAAAHAAINQFISSAQKNLKELPSTRGKEDLANLLTFILHRQA